ncbi:ATP-binding protein [Spiroplasma sp. DGKH1]|uniref:ATP-binding protein n=1 Tax=Spiroplasma sp. DGKH1 TaxID=3050074 RepID=UPI0034C64B2E
MKTIEDKYEYKKTIDLLSARQKNTKDYVMLGEYIDNSISSWIGNKKENPNMKVKGLEINICIIGHGEKRELHIIDNAYGLTKEEMSYAIKHGKEDKINLKNNTNLNHHGVGLKNASFWAGNKIEFFSKSFDSKESVEWIFDIDMADNNDEGRVDYTVQNSNHQIKLLRTNDILENGTEIIISKIHGTKKYNWTSKKYEEILKSLGWKYSHYIKEGLKIFISSNGKKWDLISSFSITCENLKYFWDKNYEDFVTATKPKEEKENQFISAIKNIPINKTISTKFQEEIKAKFLDSFKKGEELKWHQKVKLREGVFVDGWVGINNSESSSFIKEQGISIFEMNRALWYGPNDFADKHSSQNYVATLKTEYGSSGQIDIRIVGEFNFDEAVKHELVFLEDNKKGFDWISEKAEENFNNFLIEWKESVKLYVKEWINFISKNKKWKISLGKNTEENLAKVFSNDTNFVYRPKTDKIYNEFLNTTNDAEFFIYDVQFNNVKEMTIMLINITKPNEDIDFFTYESSEEPDIDYIIRLNIQHTIWERIFRLLDSKENIIDEMIIALHKLAFVLLIFSIFIEGKENNTLKTLSNTYNNLIDIVNNYNKSFLIDRLANIIFIRKYNLEEEEDD